MFHAFSSRTRALCALSAALALAVGAASGASAAQVRPAAQSLTQVSLLAQTAGQAAAMADSLPSQADRTEVAQYLSCAPRLLALGYSQGEVDALFSAADSGGILALLDQDYTPRAAEYAGQLHFRPACLQRYLSYGSENPELSAQDVVTRVNIGLDGAQYTGVTAVEDPGAVDVLVNKYSCLDSGFVPELVRMGSQYASYGGYMEPTAYEWFTKMVDDAREEGLRLYCVSAYRSYAYQGSLYQRYVKRDGQAAADTYSARAGSSEHQTGLAVDINTASRLAHFENTAQYQWLSENSWKYGFILRYPQGKSDITGFTFEPWHYRFVGLETAQAVYESGLTYDEYVAMRAEETAPAAALTLQGRECRLERGLVRLGGVYYLSAEELAEALGFEYRQTEEGTAVLASRSRVVALSRDTARCTLDGQSCQLEQACFVQNGALMVPVEGLAALLGLSSAQAERTLALTVSMPGGPVSFL